MGLYLRDGNAVASQLAHEVHRVPGVLLEAGEVLVRDGDHPTLVHEDVLRAALHAGLRGLGVGHLLPAVLDGGLVRGAAVAVADLPRPRLLGGPDGRGEEHRRGGADEERCQSLRSHVVSLRNPPSKTRASTSPERALTTRGKPNRSGPTSVRRPTRRVRHAGPNTPRRRAIPVAPLQ